MKQDDMLDAHIDFNWNNRIKMHRAVNLLIYVGECHGGEFATAKVRSTCTECHNFHREDLMMPKEF